MEKRSHFRGAKSLRVRRQLVWTDGEAVLSIVFAGIQACPSWERCYPPLPIVPLFTGLVMQSMNVASITDQSVYLTVGTADDFSYLNVLLKNLRC